MPLEDRQELASRDDLLGDEDVAERPIDSGSALQAERLLDVLVGREAFVDQEVAEPQARDAPQGALVDGRSLVSGHV